MDTSKLDTEITHLKQMRGALNYQISVLRILRDSPKMAFDKGDIVDMMDAGLKELVEKQQKELLLIDAENLVSAKNEDL